MTAVQVFTHSDFGCVRIVEINGEPWFVGKDVATALGYMNSRKALADHVDAEDKGVTNCDTPGGAQSVTVINESGMYSLILTSKLPGAKQFKRWVTSEVLPSIRKTGRYAVEQTPAAYCDIERRQITTDDLLKASELVSACSNTRLPYVLGFLKMAGIELPAESLDRPGEKTVKRKASPDAPEHCVEMIRTAVEDYGMTHRQVSEIMGVPIVYIWRYLSGTIRPRPDNAERYMERLGSALAEMDF